MTYVLGRVPSKLPPEETGGNTQPRRHRRPGQTRFGSSGPPPKLGDNVREILAVSSWTLIGLAWGMSRVATGPSVGDRSLGAAAALAAAIGGFSYALRFQAGALGGQRWNMTCWRRALRAALSYSWVALFVGVSLAWLITRLR
jgi:hypothetical protein